MNRARAGRSSRTFFTEGLWDRVRDGLQPGDFVLIQFGHNDGGPPDQDLARGSLPGIGDEYREVTMPDGRKESVYTFGWYLRKFIAETRERPAPLPSCSRPPFATPGRTGKSSAARRLTR